MHLFNTCISCNFDIFNLLNYYEFFFLNNTNFENNIKYILVICLNLSSLMKKWLVWPAYNNNQYRTKSEISIQVHITSLLFMS
jgi:hypothetical protein